MGVVALQETLSALGEMTLAISRATSADAIYREALASIQKVTRTERAAVALFDPDGVMRFKASLGLSSRYRAAVEGHTPWTPGQREVSPLLVEDVALEPTLAAIRPALEAEGIRALAMVPLVTGGGTIGKFMVYHPARHAFGADELHLASIVAAHTAFALDHQRAVDALRASEERHRSVVEHLREVVFQTDLDDRWTFLNPSWESITGHPVAQTLGRPFLDFVEPEDHPAVLEARARLLSGEVTEARLQLRCLTRAGTHRWVEACCSLARGPGGAPRGRAGTLTDVTEQRALARALEEAEARLWETQRQESLVAMAGGIAHDFNNLLMGVLGNAGVALSSLGAESPVRPALEDVVLAARRAADLTRQLVAYTGRSSLSRQALDLSALVQESARLLATVISRRATLTLDCPAGLPPVQGDATQLRQVAMNLLTNASDALGDHTGTIVLRTEHLEVGAALLARAVPGHGLRAGPCVSLTVRDSGAGMAEATRRRIFDPFFTTKFPGRGLGLAAVLGIVRAHQGAILVDSVPGEGTVLQVLLPEAQGPVVSAASPAPEQAPPATRTRTVLVVDDEPMVRNASGRILLHAGYQVLYAEHGRRALELLQQQAGAVDAVLLDLTMPELSGEDTLVRIQARWPGLPVVLSSGYPPEGERPPGAVAFVQKPYSAQALREVMGRALGS